MDCVVSKLEAYIDDSRVGSPNRQTHLAHLEAVFAALAANGLTINLDKCVFACPGTTSPSKPPRKWYPQRQRTTPLRSDPEANSSRTKFVNWTYVQ
jgi:hypothetical protein